jgi:hypothetical protein
VTGVALDGVPVPAAQITQPDTGDITVQAGAAPADGLVAGVHTITFPAAVTGGGPAVTTSSSATLSWIQASVPATLSSAAVSVAVNQPDIAVSNLVSDVNSSTGAGTTGFIGTGMHMQLNVDVRNLGFGTPQTSLTITLPAGLVLDFAIRDQDADGGPPLTCPQIGSAPPQYKCALGSVPILGGDPGVQIFVTTTAHPPVGTIGTITVSAAPDPGEGTDTNPANNSASTPVRFTGLAALSFTVTPTATKVLLGAQTTVTLTIHNAGPQPAEQVTAFIGAQGSGDKSGHTGCCAFDITGFTGTTSPPGVARHGPPVFPTSAVEWFVSTLAPGSSITATLTVKARMLGIGQLQLFGGSTATDPNCPNDDCPGATAFLQAIAAQPTPTPRVMPPATVPAPLAATGPASRSLLGLGVLLLVTGTTVTLAARRRQTR